MSYDFLILSHDPLLICDYHLTLGSKAELESDISKHSRQLETQKQELVNVESKHTCVCTQEQKERVELSKLQRRHYELEIEDRVSNLHILTPLNPHYLSFSHHHTITPSPPHSQNHRQRVLSRDKWLKALSKELGLRGCNKSGPLSPSSVTKLLSQAEQIRKKKEEEAKKEKVSLHSCHNLYLSHTNTGTHIHRHTHVSSPSSFSAGLY